MSRLRMSLFSGAGAAAASIAAIMLLARAEGKPAVRPVNATGHVLWGPHAAVQDEIDGRHTIPGIAINVGAAFFWGAIFASLLPARGKIPASQIFTRAFVTSIAAAVIDYGLVPRRLRPGWELALKTRSVVMALVALGAGLAAGGVGAQTALSSNDAGGPR